jgi:hypothetical protein
VSELRNFLTALPPGAGRNAAKLAEGMATIPKTANIETIHGTSVPLTGRFLRELSAHGTSFSKEVRPDLAGEERNFQRPGATAAEQIPQPPTLGQYFNLFCLI